jgi:hypothetical protein
LIGCGGGTAIGSRFDVSFYGQWVWSLKNHIDKFFIQLFQPAYLLNSENQEKLQIQQYDASEDLPVVENPYDAASVLIAEESNYLLGWGILRRMMRDSNYRTSVLLEFKNIQSNMMFTQIKTD